MASGSQTLALSKYVGCTDEIFVMQRVPRVYDRVGRLQRDILQRMCHEYEAMRRWMHECERLPLPMHMQTSTNTHPHTLMPVYTYLCTCAHMQAGQLASMHTCMHNRSPVSSRHSPKASSRHSPKASSRHSPKASSMRGPKASARHGPRLPQGTALRLPQCAAPRLPQCAAPRLPQGIALRLPQGTVPRLPQGTALRLPQGTALRLPQGTVLRLQRSILRDMRAFIHIANFAPRKKKHSLSKVQLCISIFFYRVLQ